MSNSNLRHGGFLKVIILKNTVIFCAHDDQFSSFPNSLLRRRVETYAGRGIVSLRRFSGFRAHRAFGNDPPVVGLTDGRVTPSPGLIAFFIKVPPGNQTMPRVLSPPLAAGLTSMSISAKTNAWIWKYLFHDPQCVSPGKLRPIAVAAKSVLRITFFL
jgi:hypothetical protein